VSGIVTANKKKGKKYMDQKEKVSEIWKNFHKDLIYS
jgi:hypothetical protein